MSQAESEAAWQGFHDSQKKEAPCEKWDICSAKFILSGLVDGLKAASFGIVLHVETHARACACPFHMQKLQIHGLSPFFREGDDETELKKNIASIQEKLDAARCLLNALLRAARNLKAARTVIPARVDR